MISIIIVNYNTADVLIKCIESIAQFENIDNIEVVVIDNNSPDDSAAVINMLCEKYKFIKSILLEKQAAFSHANNTGFNSSKGEYILIMNPDIVFTKPILDKLINKIQSNDKIGAICPALKDKDGNFQRNYFQRYPTIRQFIFFHSILAKIFYRSSSLMNKFLENQDIDTNSGKLYFVEQIPFAFFFTKRDIYKSIGKMDENYFLFFEDMDMSYNISKHYKLAIDTSIEITHLGGASFKNKNNWNLYGLYISSMIYFFKKHYSWLSTFTLKALSVSNSILVLTLENIKKVFGKSDSYRIKKHKFFLEKLFD